MGETDQQTAIIRQLFDEYADSLYRYAKYSLPPDIDARDVVQEVFLRAFRSWHGFQGQSSAKTWLYQIARNHIYDLLRKKRRERTHTETHVVFDGVTNMETLIELEDALSRLQPSHREVLNLRWLQDMSIAEVSEVLGWSESKVRVTFHRAKHKLREMLRDVDDVRQTPTHGGETVHGKR